MEYKGSITTKKIDGKEYYVHQYRDGRTVRNKSLSKLEAYELSFLLNYNKHHNIDEFIAHQFKCNVSYGKSLFLMMDKYAHYKKRYVFNDIDKYIHDDLLSNKVLALYGLRRTGKTTLIFQTLLAMSFEDFAKSIYIKVDSKNTFYDLLDDLAFLTERGFNYIFIDEVTLLDDFISLASSLSDIYGLRSKIILSGTDSLGFLIARYNELYDRVILVHTTYISYKEFYEVLDIDSIDTYIEYGGLMSIEGEKYNQDPLFKEGTINEYIDSAIVHNIEHSLKHYHEGERFFALRPFVETNELANIINRIIENNNHYFAISVIRESFKSHDYGSLKQLLRKSNDPQIIQALGKINEDEVINRLMFELDIINKEKQTQQVDTEVLNEVEAYLDLLDLCKDVEIVNSTTFKSSKKKVIIQPGLRYSQAKTLLNILFEQDSVNSLPLPLKEFIKDKLLSDIKGRMLEEIVLYQTSLNNDCFKLTFSFGEYDMVKLDKINHKSDIYEIKYSSNIDAHQYRFLNNDEYLDIVELAYYPVRNKYVIYRGKNLEVDGIKYINVENYLKSL